MCILDALVSFPVAGIEHSDKTSQERKGLLELMSRVQSIMVGAARQQDHIMSEVRRREPWIQTTVQPTFFILYTPEIPALGMVPPTIKLSFPLIHENN